MVFFQIHFFEMVSIKFDLSSPSIQDLNDPTPGRTKCVELLISDLLELTKTLSFPFFLKED